MPFGYYEKAITLSDSRDLTTGTVATNLARLAGPMVFGIMAVISVSLIDTYYVGQLGPAPLAALSFTFPVTLSISSIAIGLGAGASSVVSRAVGSGDRDDAKRLATDSIVLAVGIVILLSSVGFFTVDWLFSLLGAQGEVLELIGRYMRIWFLSVPLLVLPIVANAIVRAVGDAFWPSAVMVTSAVINISVTPILVFGWGPIPALDIEGAALGTTVAWAFTLVFGFLLVSVREKMLTLARPTRDALMNSWARVLAVGVPAGLGNAVNPLGIGVVTGILATYGDSVVAGFGVATRIESLSVIPMLALSSAIGPFSGQNWGGDKISRVIDALKISYLVCIVWAAVLSVAFWFLAAPIAAIFTDDESIIETTTTYLQIVPLSVWGYGMVIIGAGAFNAIGKSGTGLIYYLTRSALLYVPLSFMASLLAGSWAVFLGIALANGIAGLAVGGFTIWWLSRKKNDEPVPI